MSPPSNLCRYVLNVHMLVNGNGRIIIYVEIRFQKELQPIMLEYGWHASAQFD